MTSLLIMRWLLLAGCLVLSSSLVFAQVDDLTLEAIEIGEIELTLEVTGVAPPVISDGPTVRVNGKEAEVAWTTDQPSSSQVIVQPNTPGAAHQLVGTTIPTTVHLVAVSLEPRVTYNAAVISRSNTGGVVTARIEPFRATGLWPVVSWPSISGWREQLTGVWRSVLRLFGG